MDGQGLKISCVPAKVIGRNAVVIPRLEPAPGDSKSDLAAKAAFSNRLGYETENKLVL